MPSFYEFFAGGGMVRAGLGSKWRCLYANDFDHRKGHTYRENWGDGELRTADIRSQTVDDIPEIADLSWASFPCQDLSLAGGGAGLKGDRSGTFWPFWNLMKDLIKNGRAPQLIVLENVCGTLTSHGGKDFTTICNSFRQAGYVFGAMVIDASLFLPQSRPRLFVIGAKRGMEILPGLTAEGPLMPWHTKTLKTAYNSLPKKTKDEWIWWNLPLPPSRKAIFAEIIEDSDDAITWFSPGKTQELLDMMSDINQKKVFDAQSQGRKIVGCVYKRTRPDENGRKIQRAEIRFDDMSGCLRTPAGGSSRQVVVIVDGKSIRARLITSRETARLMGLPDDYKLPNNYNEAYHLTGDGVAVPVVRYLSQHIFEPLLRFQGRKTIAA